jgi:low temperature requirement protein LtrA
LSPTTRTPHLTAVLRGNVERVTPLELFFDLVFVLALTQCTALMADVPTWEGMAQAMAILMVLWWSWGGYAWLTSVVDPEEGIVRIAMFAAMAAFLICAISVPGAFDDEAFLFAGAYAMVRIAHIALFVIASRDQPDLRTSVIGLAGSTAVGVGLLLAAAATDDVTQGALWATAIALDLGGPFFFGVEGWQMVPRHFVERFGLIIIIALGESIAAIGAGIHGAIDTGIVVAAVLGVVVAAALWWLYFDFFALVAERRLVGAAPGRERNSLGRDSYGYLHFGMVAGIVLVALGMKKTLGEVDAPLELVPAVALLGGAGVYLLSHVAFRWRNIHRFSTQRFVVALVCFALIPLAEHIDSLASLAILAAVLVVLLVYESLRFSELRARMRHEPEPEAAGEAA